MDAEIKASIKSYKQCNVMFLNTYRTGTAAPVMLKADIVLIKTTKTNKKG